MTRNRLLIFFGVAAAVAALLVSSSLASAISGSQANEGYGRCWQNGAGNCYHWARTAPGLTLKVENDVSSAWSGYFNTAVKDWTTPVSDPVPLTMIGQNAYSTSNSCAGLTGLVRMCSRKYGFNGWLGLASIWVASDGEHIIAGTVKLNDSYFNTSTYKTAAWRNLVSCQELAHTIGLNHEDENFNNANLGSCMDYTNDPDGGAGGAVTNDPSNELPSLDDKKTLANIYAYVDTSTTVAASSGPGRGNSAGNDEDAVPPGAGPQHGDIFVKHLPDGTTLITHVFWVEKGNPR